MYTIRSLGSPTIPSPVPASVFVDDNRRILENPYVVTEGHPSAATPRSLEIAGPRKCIYFEPSKTKAAIVTCGGLSPGINDVIRAVVMELYYGYGVENISGVRYGFQGLIPSYGHPLMDLTPDVVKDFHLAGGSKLGSSRGSQDIGEMVDSLRRLNINLFFCIGGDGTMKAVQLIAGEIERRNLDIAVVGIPKTIDNDLSTIDKTFGFDTAIAEAASVIECAHVESKGAPNGVGLVKIMGRTSGHIAVSAALANNDVNFVLIPESPFDLYGEKGFLAVLEHRLKVSNHAVVIVAEGAGQEHRPPDDAAGRDPSGNIRLFDIGVFLKEEIERYFKEKNVELNLKYIDPSYLIRSVPANASDSIYCMLLGQYAVHAAMAGRTAMVVGLYGGDYVHLPLASVTSRKKVDTEGTLWRATLAGTGQPAEMRNKS
ncbi:MAG: diphosphate--fructose-6-phosphate 1-phosphotransferase [delta proteobacterium MLS_D]|nr:MAG: diphosphate--fructose-6-phosphate 1-phosphotransferase [delta proteobacterium MLS_D]